MSKIALVMALPLLLGSSMAVAQTGAARGTAERKTPASADSDCAQAKAQGRECTLVFDSDAVDGSTPSADGVGIMAVQATTHSSLIRVRTSFRDRILRSADGLW